LVTSRPLEKLRVLVTGASSGIGAAVSSLLAERGARVVGTGRDAAALAAASAVDGGPFETTFARDLLEPSAPSAVVEAAAAALDGLDVVVSSAGAGWLGLFEQMPPAEIDTLLDINLRAPMHLAHAASPYLRKSVAGGQLVLVGSIAGLVGVAQEVAYSAAKAGLQGLADSLRAEWATDQVTVTLVSPGPVDTPFYLRRNRPYRHSWPRPIPVATAARAIVRAIETRREDAVIPTWLALAARLHGGWPSLYRTLGGMGGGRGRPST
jgi:NAD(P)-dependent dehydrogenase (short-subunit alcohol dehydrogenase family)